jgi:hypothetical protein
VQRAVDQAHGVIIADLGSIDDLPRELANTIANFYYECYLPVESREPTGHDIASVLNNFIDQNARLTAGLDHVPRMIQALREIDKRTRPDLYDYSVKFFLDILKYKIADAGNKTGIRRMLERKLKRVNEIDNLLEIMRL